jgi:hypothetical protein
MACFWTFEARASFLHHSRWRPSESVGQGTHNSTYDISWYCHLYKWNQECASDVIKNGAYLNVWQRRHPCQLNMSIWRPSRCARLEIPFLSIQDGIPRSGQEAHGTVHHGVTRLVVTWYWQQDRFWALSHNIIFISPVFEEDDYLFWYFFTVARDFFLHNLVKPAPSWTLE